MHKKASIVIVGASFAGLSAYLVLRKRLGNSVDITLIDQRDTFTYIPALHNCLGNAGYLKKIQFNYQKYYGDDFLQDEVMKITSSTITTKSGKTLEGDYIIIATGSRTNTYGISNIKKYGYMCRFAEDVERINEALPKAHTITVVGGGYTGVEIISSIAERFPDKKLRIIHAMPRLLERYSEHISKTVHDWLTNHGVEVVVDTMMTDIIETKILCSSPSLKKEDGDGFEKAFESDMTIFSGGVSINNESFRDTLEFMDYSATTADTIFVCGDVAIKGLQTTAHNAMIEGRRIGNIVSDAIVGITKDYPPLENWTTLALALGNYDGMISTGTKGFYMPYVLGFCKRVVERRCMLEFMYHIMLWV